MTRNDPRINLNPPFVLVQEQIRHSGTGALQGDNIKELNWIELNWVTAKLAHLFTFWVFEMTPFQPLHFISVLWLLWHHTTPLQHTHNWMHVVTMNSGRGYWKGWDNWKGVLIKFIINTIVHSLEYWPTIGLYFITYKKKATFICTVCGKIAPHRWSTTYYNIPV